MKEWLQVLKAADAAARWHVHQRRKGPAEEPYINHLVEVAMLVADATDGSDTKLVIAALLHDAIEDCEVPRELIAESFGEDVAAIVEEVTDDKSLPKAVRKEEQIKTSSTKSPRAKLLKLADKTSNLRAVAASAPAEWSVKRRIEYVRWARDVAKGLRGVNQRLETNLMKLPPRQSGHSNRAFNLLAAEDRLLLDLFAAPLYCPRHPT
jgi:GTP diphosphokinase / guanosine-3',5'-bis(diphosphate) 3'-diphosphatase